MKTIKYFVFSVLIISIFSCEVETEDIVTANAVEGGVTVNIDADGKVLGIPVDPADLENTSVNFTDVELDLTVNKLFAGENVTKYELIKSFNGGAESVAAVSESLPLNLTYSSIGDFLENTGVTDSNDLRIGDVFTFRTRVTNKDGSVYMIHNGGSDAGTVSFTVSCSSDLAYTYHVTTHRSDGASWDQGFETLVEKAPGLYKTVTTGGWAVGTIAPDQGFDFVDVCGSLTVPDQTLAQGYYSNAVYQTADQAAASFVDGATGNLHIEYSISFSSGDSEYANDYIRQ